MRGIAQAKVMDWEGKGLGMIDLSAERFRESGEMVWEYAVLKGVVEREIAAQDGRILWGGYLERRKLYAGTALFDGGKAVRDMHLGVDFWAAAGSAVYAPVDGWVHSQQDNAQDHDYGPTVVLSHVYAGAAYHTLYGHLSRASLGLHGEGEAVKAGELIGWLGKPEENVGWPPHLHFQVILDMEGMRGDYPGVAAEKDLGWYGVNCPDPRGWVKSSQ